MKNLVSHIKMDKESLTFGDLKIEEINFTAIKLLFLKKDVDIENALASNKMSSDYLYDDYKIKPLHLMLPKMKAYVKSYDGQTKWMYFLIEDDDLLAKENTFWTKWALILKKEFDGEPIYNKKLLKTQIKSNSHEATDLHDKKCLRQLLIILV